MRLLKSPFDVLRRRLRGHHLVPPRFARPAEVVHWLCGVQAQVIFGSLWGIGLRTANGTESDVERAIAERTIVRSWPMRGTLHFVAADDIRWMLQLLTPRIASRGAARRRQLDLDSLTLVRSRNRLEKALSGGNALTRPQAYRALKEAGIATAEQRGLHILLELGMQGILCFGPRMGRQPSFVLLDEWIPASRAIDHDEALGELAGGTSPAMDRRRLTISPGGRAFRWATHDALATSPATHWWSAS